MQKATKITTAVICGIIPAVLYSYATGPDPGYTGAPGDSTCVNFGCHTGTALNGGGGNVQWMPDGKSLLVYSIRADRGSAPALPLVPPGPHVQESLGGGAPAPTLEDMLASPHDEDLFTYYATSQLASVDLSTGKSTPIGKPAIIESAHISPNGNDLLVTSIHKPY